MAAEILFNTIALCCQGVFCWPQLYTMSYTDGVLVEHSYLNDFDSLCKYGGTRPRGLIRD
jgi:hypothetical protein